MGGLSSILTGLVLVGISLWFFTVGDSLQTALLFAVGALYLFWRGYHGAGVGEEGDLTAPLEFVTNPRGAIVDEAIGAGTERLSGLFEGIRSAPEEDQPKFDPDAIIAKYVENRPDAAAAAPVPVRPTFGRKGA